MVSVKGKLFEFFVSRLLMFCGFKPVVKDGLLVFDGNPGTMVQGLGQAHNADVLLEPPFQTPFYFSTRLLVECKCYSDTIGLPVIRNAFGLREDINRFDIVTEEILRNRQSQRTTNPTFYPMKRYNYQVAVASLNGYKSTAIPYAQAHKIPLISFSESALFDAIRECINLIEERSIGDEVFAGNVLSCLRSVQSDTYYDVQCFGFSEEMRSFLENVEMFRDKILVGLLENGTIIFLIRTGEQRHSSRNRMLENEQYGDGFKIYWNHNSSSWELIDGDQSYLFELPKEIYKEWIESMAERREAALQIKQSYFSKIILFESVPNCEGSVRTIYLSERFIEDARNQLRGR